MVNVPAKAIPQVQSTEGKDLWSLESGRYINLVPRHDLPETNNPHLWAAMQHLQDRQRLVKGVLKGQGGLGNDQPIGPGLF
jgi:ABC-type transport system substrate-binding protein